MSKVLILLAILFLISCSENSTTTSSGFDGHWRVTVAGATQDCQLESNENSLYFCGTKYNGNCTDKNFSGSYEMYSSGVSYKYTLSLSRNGDNISGTLKAKLSFNGQSSQNSENINGYRIK